MASTLNDPTWSASGTSGGRRASRADRDDTVGKSTFAASTLTGSHGYRRYGGCRASRRDRDNTAWTRAFEAGS